MSKDGYATWVLNGLDVRVETFLNITMDLDIIGTLMGKVVDVRGNPIDGVEIRIRLFRGRLGFIFLSFLIINGMNGPFLYAR